MGRHRTFERGETVFAPGDSGAGFATLVSGALKMTTVDADGSEHIVSLVHPAGFVGQLFSASEEFEIKALVPSKLCMFGSADYERALVRYPALSGALLKQAIQDGNMARRALGLVTRPKAQARVAGLIAAFADGAGHAPCHPASSFDLPLTRGEMADLLGLTIETVSRQLSALERQGLIRREGARGIHILDAPGLHSLAE